MIGGSREKQQLEPWLLPLVAFCVLGVSLFFSTANFALKAYSKVKLEDLLSGQGRQKMFDYLQEDHHKLQLTCAVIRTSANLVLVLTITRWLWLPDRSLPFWKLCAAFFCSILLLSAFSVAIPHAWAKYGAERFLAVTLPAIRAVRMLMTPLLAVMHAVDVVVRRLSGVSIDPETNHDAEQEILEAVHEGEEEGVVDEQERKMIESVIEMRDVTIGQIMTPRTEIVALDVDSTIDQIKANIAEHGHSRLPVYDENLDDIIGMLYVKDLLQFLDSMPEDFSIRSILRPCYYVPESKLMRNLFTEFRHKQLHVAIVLDEYGGTSGMVTFEDLIEEIVGEIADEYEPQEPPLIKEIDAKTMEIDGRMRTDDLDDDYNISLPESEDYETVGGFIFSSLGRIPAAGETFQHENLMFTILEATERKIGQVKLEVLPVHENAARKEN